MVNQGRKRSRAAAPLTIFVIGCGKIGSAFARQRLAAGDRVWGLKRSIQSSAADADSSADLDSVLKNESDVPLLYATTADAAVSQLRQTQADPDLIIFCANPGLRGGGDNHLLALAMQICAAFPNAFYLYTGSTAVYADAPQSTCDEQGILDTSDKAQHLLAIEQIFLNCADAAVLRLAAIVGPQREHLRKRIRQAEHSLGVRGPLDRRFNYIHEANVLDVLHIFIRARQLFISGQSTNDVQGIYNCAAPDQLSLRGYLQQLLAEQGRSESLNIETQTPLMPDRIIDSEKLYRFVDQVQETSTTSGIEWLGPLADDAAQAVPS